MVVTTRSEEGLRRRIECAIQRVLRWLKHAFELVVTKTEMVVLTRRESFGADFQVWVEGAKIWSSPSARYLGVRIKPQLSFNENKAFKRRLLIGVANSILLYGAEIWAGTLELKANRQRLTSVQCVGALRVAMAYRTVSAVAVMVIAGTIPILWLAKEWHQKYVDRQRNVRCEKDDRRTETVRRWQSEWDNWDKGRWPHRLIPQIQP